MITFNFIISLIIWILLYIFVPIILPISIWYHTMGRWRLWSSSAVRRSRALSAARGTATMRTISKAVTMDNINPNIIRLEYAVRGPVVIHAEQIKKELQKVASKSFKRVINPKIGDAHTLVQEIQDPITFDGQGASKPFKRVINANIGDAHAMGQKPITFVRQVLACISCPDLIDSGKFPKDVQDKAKSILASCGGGSVGAYTASHGIELIRRHVADFIQRRDGHPSNWEDIVLSTGASTAIKNCLQLFCNDINGKPSGVMIPIPQYPLYSASLAEYGLVKVDYFLDEDNGWALSIPELQRAIDNAGDCAVRGLVVINPGNPTGQVLTRQNIEDIIKFAHKNSLFIFADEVYQHNIYAKESKFFSFKKILRELGKPYSDEVELASFMSISKGFMGECGLRGGWMELVNMDKDVQAQLYKCISAMLCPTVLGQAAVDCLVDPPKEGSPSHAQWIEERTAILDSLNKRAKMIAETFNKMPGFTCNEVQGAMYAFPALDLPPKAIEAAKAANQSPDVFYAFKLLEETGICVVPGSGFGQRPGTYHFRTTILPQPAMLQEMLDIFKKFHEKFTKEFS